MKSHGMYLPGSLTPGKGLRGLSLTFYFPALDTEAKEGEVSYSWPQR